MGKRKSFGDKIKFEIVMEVLKGQRILAEIASQYEVQANQISRWKKEFIENGPSVFSKGKSEAEQEWESEKVRY